MDKLLLELLEIFAQESLDVSAKGVLRLLACPAQLWTARVTTHLLLPRDYHPPVSGVQRERVEAAVLEVLCR
ncbi:hypothetical protein [Methylomonas koyamae]|uniref:Uncharacterized protein n=1 Tax=Methylomonas koyamae TaxID=702114 RepID=A0A291IDI3_9GAMM|nr:hypothetical protein [Methylomonas koyamae]ATG88334.1 hypothetical protein MKLM6_0045 [Methylomonas koyamae]OAI25536.1 hypothetical protein A1356_00790 [Methylomonas koyamae]